MRENLTQLLGRYRRAFSEFSNGQKAVAIVGSGALLLAAFLVFRWVSAPRTRRSTPTSRARTPPR